MAMTDGKIHDEQGAALKSDTDVTAQVRAVRQAIEEIDVSYGLRRGQKPNARRAHREAKRLTDDLLERVAELERRCRKAESGIAVTDAIQAAMRA
jgi:hypothetical protein